MRIPGIKLREEYLEPSYVEQEVRRRRNWLLDNGQFFLLRAELSESSVFWILAALEARVVLVPVHAASTEAEIYKYRELLGDVVELSDAALADSSKKIFSRRDTQGIAAILFSSGSTGNPKAVAITEKNLLASAKAHGAQHALTEKDCWLLSLPLFHIGGFSIVSRAYYLHQDIALAPRLDLEAAQFWLGSGAVSGVSLVPTMLWRIVEANPRPSVAVKIVLLGGAALAQEIRDRALAAKLPIKQSYGLTESCSQVFSDWATYEGSPQNAGKASVGVEYKILENGELCLKGEMISPGYWRNSALLSNRDAAGFFHTGDLVVAHAGGINVLGRLSEMIISGGENIFPAEIEGALLSIDWVEDAAIVGLPSAEWGEVVAALVVLRDKSPPDAMDEIKQILKTKLNPWRIPKKFLLGKSVPRNAMKKIIRQEVLKLFLP